MLYFYDKFKKQQMPSGDENQKAEYLIPLIERAEVINEFEKSEFLKLSQNLSPKQTEEVIDFFLKAEKEIKDVKDEYDQKKSKAYTDYLPILNKAFRDSKKLINKEREIKGEKINKSKENKLLDKLDNL
jgi:hypothetical protein